MTPRSVRLQVVVVTLLTALYAGRLSATVPVGPSCLEGATVPRGPSVPALEPPLAVQDVPELATARPPATWTVATSAVESDADHVARLLAGGLRCGDTYANDVGGRNSECLAVGNRRLPRN